MDIAAIKRGDTFRVSLAFTDAEWAEVYPFESATAQLIDAAKSAHTLTVTASAVNRAIYLSASTAEWSVGPAAFDVLVVRGGIRTHIPAGKNVPLAVIQGVTP